MLIRSIGFRTVQDRLCSIMKMQYDNKLNSPIQYPLNINSILNNIIAIMNVPEHMSTTTYNLVTMKHSRFQRKDIWNISMLYLGNVSSTFRWDVTKEINLIYLDRRFARLYLIFEVKNFTEEIHLLYMYICV